jgi:hypothetical protein
MGHRKPPAVGGTSLPARQHADASPSSAHQWLNCPASVTRARGRVRAPTIYTREGTAAHELAELLLRSRTSPKGVTTVVVDDVEVSVNEEMLDAVGIYVDYVSALPNLQIETRVRLPLGDEDLFGTADAFSISNDARRIEVVDFKYGRGVPVPPDSAQFRIYGLGVLNEIGPNNAEEMALTVVQPRTNPDFPINTAVIPIKELLDWEQVVLKPAIERLAAGDTTETPGDWCRWCVRAGECQTLAQLAQTKARVAFGTQPPDVYSLSNEELGQILDHAEIIAAWVGTVRAEASARLDNGQDVPGWKLVPKRAVRQWDDPAGALADLTQRGVSPPDIMRIETIGAVERAMKRHGIPLKVLDSYTKKESSGSTLAPDGDPRKGLDTHAKDVFNLLENVEP